MDSERKISSQFRELWKVTSVVVTAIIGYFLWRTYVGLPVPLGYSFWPVLLFFVSGLLSVIRTWRGKKVVLTPDGLLISRRFFFWDKFIFVPFEDIESVSANRLFGINAGALTVNFKHETDFGKRIMFVPNSDRSWSHSKLIEEISQTAARSEREVEFNNGEKGRLFE